MTQTRVVDPLAMQVAYGTNSILKRGRGRFKDVRRLNIAVVAKVSDSLKTMLGPKGMNIMLVNGLGDYIVTNDGLVTLEHMDIENPVTRLLVEVAKNQEEVNGDGTKTAVILTGELLKKADLLLNKKIHPTTIMNGYSKAKKRALEALAQNVSTVSIGDITALEKIARTTIGGRLSGETKEHIARLAVSAVTSIAEESGGKPLIDKDLISARPIAGGSINDSLMVSGCIVFKDKPNEGMPDRVEGARIALIGSSLDPLTYRADMDMKEMTINSAKDFRRLIEFEKEFNRHIVECAKRMGANVLFCKKRMNEPLLAAFSEARMLAFNLVSAEDMARLEMATGAKLVMKIDELDASDLGEAGLVEYRKVAGEDMLFVEKCRNPKVKAALIRGGTIEVVAEMERVFEDATKALSAAIRNEKVVPGGGAIEMELAKDVLAYSRTIEDKEQLSIEAFSEALEELPRGIAINAGLDKINTLAELRAGHMNDLRSLGVDALNRRVCDTAEIGLLDAYTVKQNAIKVATETAIMILGISDLIMVTNKKVVKQEKAQENYEKQRLQGNKVKDAFKTVDELKEVEKLDRTLTERKKHPETW